jgi:NADH-quinone oxidoreductase subunit B
LKNDIEETGTGGQVLTTTTEKIYHWAREAAAFPVRLGLSCCAIELAPLPDPRHDAARFGASVFRAQPAASDLLIVAGTLSEKMAPIVRRLWDQMPSPKWAMALGACATCGGPYRTYAVTQGLDRILPVDVYVAGCPPRPEAFLEGLERLKAKIEQARAVSAARPVAGTAAAP